MDSHALMWAFELRYCNPILLCGPSNLAYGLGVRLRNGELARFGVARRVGIMEVLVWYYIWGDRLPCFGVAPRLRVMDSQASVWPHKLCFSAPARSNLGDALRHLCGASGVWLMDPHAFVWPLKLGVWSPTLWCGP